MQISWVESPIVLLVLSVRGFWVRALGPIYHTVLLGRPTTNLWYVVISLLVDEMNLHLKYLLVSPLCDTCHNSHECLFWPTRSSPDVSTTIFRMRLSWVQCTFSNDASQHLDAELTRHSLQVYAEPFHRCPVNSSIYLAASYQYALRCNNRSVWLLHLETVLRPEHSFCKQAWSGWLFSVKHE